MGWGAQCWWCKDTQGQWFPVGSVTQSTGNTTSRVCHFQTIKDQNYIYACVVVFLKKKKKKRGQRGRRQPGERKRIHADVCCPAALWNVCSGQWGEQAGWSRMVVTARSACGYRQGALQRPGIAVFSRNSRDTKWIFPWVQIHLLPLTGWVIWELDTSVRHFLIHEIWRLLLLSRQVVPDSLRPPGL